MPAKRPPRLVAEANKELIDAAKNHATKRGITVKDFILEAVVEKINREKESGILSGA